jgi:hypothetical protein
MPIVMFTAGMCTAKLLTNPRFVSWAAQATKIAGNKGIEGVMEHLTKLGMVAASSSPGEREALFEYIGVLKEAANKTKKGEAEIPMAKRVSQAPSKQPEVASSAPPLDRSMFTSSTKPTAPAMANLPTAPAGGQGGISSVANNQFASLFPGDSLGAAIAERGNA